MTLTASLCACLGRPWLLESTSGVEGGKEAKSSWPLLYGVGSVQGRNRGHALWFHGVWKGGLSRFWTIRKGRTVRFSLFQISSYSNHARLKRPRAPCIKHQQKLSTLDPSRPVEILNPTIWPHGTDSTAEGSPPLSCPSVGTLVQLSPSEGAAARLWLSDYGPLWLELWCKASGLQGPDWGLPLGFSKLRCKALHSTLPPEPLSPKAQGRV